MPKPPVRNTVAEWAVTVLLLLFGTTSIVQAYVIPTGSMENNLLVGDHLLVDKLAYAPAGSLGKLLLPYTEVKRGDIIVFRYPPDITLTYVKRVIGVPGDRVRMEDKQLFLNGRPLAEPYTVHNTRYLIPSRDSFAELTVPMGHYFALGDNRDNSSDSRVWGFVPRENIVGKPLLIYWSYNAATENYANFGLDDVVDLAQNFFAKTRWDRTFRMIRGYPIGD
jgi:signal peptidase I